MAWGLVPPGLQEALLRHEAFIYGRWLLYYGYWDFFNGGLWAHGAEGLLQLGLDKSTLLRWAREFLGATLGSSLLGASLAAPLGVAMRFLEAFLDACWLELVTQVLGRGFYGQGSDD